MPTAEVNDISMYYEIHGSGAPLVLIGGLGSDLTVLTPITDGLARNRKVLVFDNRGVGRTDQPDQPYSIPLMARDAAGLMAALSIEQADIAGISMGGMIALQLALADPSRIRRLVLVSTTAAGPKKLHMSWPMRLLWLLQWLPGMRGKHPQAKHAHRRQRAAAFDFDVAERLDQIKVPTLILHGRRDRSLPLSMAERLHTGIAGSRLRVFRGGHMFSLLSERQEFLASVDEFLTG